MLASRRIIPSPQPSPSRSPVPLILAQTDSLGTLESEISEGYRTAAARAVVDYDLRNLQTLTNATASTGPTPPPPPDVASVPEAPPSPPGAPGTLRSLLSLQPDASEWWNVHYRLDEWRLLRHTDVDHQQVIAVRTELRGGCHAASGYSLALQQLWLDERFDGTVVPAPDGASRNGDGGPEVDFGERSVGGGSGGGGDPEHASASGGGGASLGILSAGGGSEALPPASDLWGRFGGLELVPLSTEQFRSGLPLVLGDFTAHIKETAEGT